MRRLTAKMKASVAKAALVECANLLNNTWGDPFKDRELPELPEELTQDGDDYFFLCVTRIADELKARSRQ